MLIKRIDLKLVGKNIQLSIDKKKIGTTRVNQHLDNKYFDVYIRGINKKNIPELFLKAMYTLRLTIKNSLAKELKSFLNISIVDKRRKQLRYHTNIITLDYVMIW